MPKYELPNLMSRLRSLSEIAEDVIGDPVDWYVKQGEVTDDTGRMLRKMGLQETTMSDVAAARPMLKKRIETLSKRLEGVNDFIDDGEDLSAAMTALEKIVVDLKDLYANLKRASGREHKAEKKKEAEMQAQQQAQQDAEGDQSQQDAQQDAQAAQQAAKPPTPDPRQQAQAMAAQQRTQEQTYIIDGEMITEAAGDDPFGLGPNFMREIMERSGINRR